MNTSSGLATFLAQTDSLGLALFAILLLMSLLSWYFMITRLLIQRRHRQAGERFQRSFWNANSLKQVEEHIYSEGAVEPYARLTQRALLSHQQSSRPGSRLAEQGERGELLGRSLRQSMDAEATHLESGLTLLASVGATAPFVGLFGTVWGVYHALTAIGAHGAAGLEQIAGPVGEALIMTGLGLAVAIPAVLGYNALVRGNRVYLAGLDAFAHELYAFLHTGQSHKKPEAD